MEVLRFLGAWLVIGFGVALVGYWVALPIYSAVKRRSLREVNREWSESVESAAEGCGGCLIAAVVGGLLLLVVVAVIKWAWSVVFN